MANTICFALFGFCAHIGVGIAGVEGTAATNSADYAIGTFRMLHSLLFVHGFYSYQRMAKLTNFIFYKVNFNFQSRPRFSRDHNARLPLLRSAHIDLTDWCCFIFVARLVSLFVQASLVAVMMFLFGFFSAMSGQQFFADAPYQLYNVMYTALRQFTHRRTRVAARVRPLALAAAGTRGRAVGP